MPRRPGRPRPDQPVLTRRSILDAALDMVDEHGIEALSMRRLAARLGVDPMSIYHHVPGKAALVSGLVDAVFSQMRQPPADRASWQDRVREWARGYRDLAMTHPNLVLQIVSDSAAASQAAILVSEPLYAAFDAAGLGPAEVATAAGTVVDFVNGYALAMARPHPEHDPMSERLAALPADQVPTLKRVHAGVATVDAFEAGVDIIIRGASRTGP